MPKSSLSEPHTNSIYLADVLAGLQDTPKTLPSKYFYDEVGSQLFDEICDQPEYYLTRTELAIIQKSAGEMAAYCGPQARLVEYGSGSSLKTRLLLDARDDWAEYLPVDISGEHLLTTAEQLRERYPELSIHPLHADFTQSFELPEFTGEVGNTVVYFPGSTIGNFNPLEASELLTQMATLAGSGGGLLIGVDLFKSAEILNPAYNDAEGVTARFNLNMLERINREFDTDIDIDNFSHHAFLNEAESRVEMHLVSLTDQEIEIEGTAIPFTDGETIHTENSYKHQLEEFQKLAEGAGWSVEKIWTDSQNLFSVQFLRAM